MKPLRSSSLVTTTGAIIGVLGLLTAIFSLVFSFREMWPHLLSVLIELLLGVALTVLIIDRVSARQRGRDWRFAHDTVARRLAATMVAAMRLLSTRKDEGFYAAHSHRLAEFIDLCHSHFDDLDSNIVALATIVHPDLYEKSRTIQLHLSWLIRTLIRRLGSSMVPVEHWELQSVKQTATKVMEYLQVESGSDSKSVSDEVLNFLRSTEKGTRAPSTIVDLISTRLDLQTAVLETFEPSRWPGIMMDMDLDLAVRYFTIDWWLLSQLEYSPLEPSGGL